MNLHIPTSDSIPFHSTRLSVEDLYSHIAIFGQPGSGKSRACVKVLLRELVKLNSCDPERKAGMFCVDGKGGGELRQYLEAALDQAGRLDDFIVVGPMDATWNPLAAPGWTDCSIATALIEAVNTVGGPLVRRSLDPFWDNTSKDLLTALVSVARHILGDQSKSRSALNVGHLARLRPMLSKSDSEVIRTATDLAAVLPEEAGSALMEFAMLPSNTRHSVASGVGTVLGPFGREPLLNVLVPTPTRVDLDLTRIITEGKVVLFDLSNAQAVTELLPAAILAKQSFAKMILARRRIDTNQARPVFAFIEEIQRVLTAQADSIGCEANWMDTCRSAGCGVIFTTQGISSVLSKASPTLVDTLVSLAATQMWLTSSDPASIAYATRCLPTKAKYQVHRTIASSPPPPLLFPRDRKPLHQVEVRVLVPVLESIRLERLSPGTILLKKRDGSFRKIQADLAAP
jgi:hypothetical protein